MHILSARLKKHTGVAWPELLGALFQASQSQDPAQRENAFRIFSTTPQIIEKQHEDVVMTAFKGGFADSETSVRFPHAHGHAQLTPHRSASHPLKPSRPSFAPSPRRPSPSTTLSSERFSTFCHPLRTLAMQSSSPRPSSRSSILLKSRPRCSSLCSTASSSSASPLFRTRIWERRPDRTPWNSWPRSPITLLSCARRMPTSPTTWSPNVCL